MISGVYIAAYGSLKTVVMICLHECFVCIYIKYIHNFSRVNQGECEWGSMCDVVRGVKVQQLAAGVVYTYLYLSVPCTMLDVCGGCHCQCQHFRLCKLERRDVRFRDSGCLVRHFSWM